MQRIPPLIGCAITKRGQHIKTTILYIVIMPNKKVEIVGTVRFRYQEAIRKLLPSIPLRIGHLFVLNAGFARRTAARNSDRQGNQKEAK